jgi:kinesin family protein 18/19
MGKRSKDQTFGFDRVFDENTTQEEVYEATTKTLLDSVLDGYNATVFAYGATGCGKTHTITGTAAQPGIIFLTMQELFDKIQERSDEKHTEITLSYLEIYNETIRDLLEPSDNKQGLMLREDANQTVSVAGLSSHRPKDVQQVMEMIVRGNEYRTISPTAANATSSRSHAVLQINVAQKDRNADINEPHTMATLSIIDLAGSERASATKNRGERLLEGANINKSLLALGSCINALCDPRKKNHVPYRNSKLTRLLKFSLGGNCRTVMIVCVSPSSAHFDETQNTLRYANRAKNIQTKVTRNVYNVNRHVKDFLIKIDEQMALINELRAQQKNSEGAAFAKFRKLTEKREIIAKEGISRIRAAYDAASGERAEKVNGLKKLRQIERRISVLSAWIAAFDYICDSREEGEMPAGLVAMRKTAQGMLVEFENSRHMLHQRQQKNNWERAMTSSLENSVRQLQEAEGAADGSDVASLEREVELLKANAAREALAEVLEMEKGGEEVMRAVLTAQFDVLASINDIMGMSETDAVAHAKKALTRLFYSCSAAASQVIKPDGSLASSTVFPPTKKGTPKKKKVVNLNVDGPSDPPVMAPLEAVQLIASPIKGSPRRRKVFPGKKIAFSPKKSPRKRSVRWRDDTDDGVLADFDKTPQKFDSSPVAELEPPIFTSRLKDEILADDDSSPIPEPPMLNVKRNSRFEAGFLAKKSSPPGGSPNAADDTILGNSSDLSVDLSPLRSIDPGQAANRPSLSSSNDGKENRVASPAEKISASDEAKIRAALRKSRTSGASESARVVRRRSPGSSNGSPSSDEKMFTAGQARRMVRSDREPGVSVLSPRTAPVVKSARRATAQGGALSAVAAIRLAAQGGGTPRGRESVGVNKSVWR